MYDGGRLPGLQFHAQLVSTHTEKECNTVVGIDRNTQTNRTFNEEKKLSSAHSFVFIAYSTVFQSHFISYPEH